ncbi:MAG: gliding motility lipoprotein GldD [Leadbetterella sp.]
MVRYCGFCLLLVVWVMSCGKTVSDYYPKPKGFVRLDLPLATYQALNGTMPYTFEYSKHAVITPDKSKDAEPNWILVEYPELEAKIQLTYKPLFGDLKKLNAHIRDAYKLAAKHQIKAESQTEQVVNFKNGKNGVIIQIEGEVPSHFQFYMTDTTKHYIRGAVYLKYATLNDSLTPVVDYLKKDCLHLMETLQWKK